MKKSTLLIGLLMFVFIFQTKAQHSIARNWNEKVLEAIRYDFARPTVHARNLHHISAAMYDAWAAYEPTADTYFLGKTVQGFKIPFMRPRIPEDVRVAQAEAISYAVYRLIMYRFRNGPFFLRIELKLNEYMEDLGYDIHNLTASYHCGPAELGNYIAQQIILYGQQDGANDENDYENLFYQPSNPPLTIINSGNPDLEDFNRWQPIRFQGRDGFVGQSGIVPEIPTTIPDFLSPEWGGVAPFALKDSDAVTYQRDGFDYKVYLDPGPPPYIDDQPNATGLDNHYKWGHILVGVWSSHLRTGDLSRWDISPASKGNISNYPTEISDYSNFYNFLEGGDTGTGYDQNPKTGLPYEPNLVKRSDYTRVLAEFWADGPDSETPPGHWYTILNTVNDHPDLEKKMAGIGPVLDDLEWDVKAYFTLGGAMHDAAIAAWSVKGWYDYIRPVSAIRGMAEYGQGSDPNLPNYHALGVPMIPNFTRISNNEVELYGWRGPDFNAWNNVDWHKARDWWPFQRPNFVTPPFAGYVSGHSTFSRAAAEVLTGLTGDPFFPGGMGEFFCPRNEFLTFESGPSEDVTLQWATYRDASDQCSLSRIWGGIHPPADDIPGRIMGEKIGVDAFNYALPYFSKTPETSDKNSVIYPNPTNCGVVIELEQEGNLPTQVFHTDGKLLLETALNFENGQAYLNFEQLANALLIVVVRDLDGKIILQKKVVKQN